MTPAERDLDLAVLRLAWRLDAIDEWRDKIDRRLGEHEAQLDHLMRADEIADAISERLKSERTMRLSWAQRVGAFLIGTAAVAANIRGFWS